MKIALVYFHGNPATTGAYMEKVMKNAGMNYDLFGVEDPSSVKPGYDIYIRFDHGDYKFDIPPDRRPAVFYAIDTHLPKPYKKIRKQAGHYDIVFCAQKQGCERLRRDKKIDTQWLPLGCDPAVHLKRDIPKIYDIGFVGRNARKFSRGKQMDLLKKKFPCSFIGQAEFTRMSEIYSASRVGFNSSIINDINMRVFEIMSCGCFLLTNRIINNGMEELFEDGKHYVSYKNDRELAELAEYYLEHDNEREAIAAAGRELVVKRHTYFHRVQSMFNYIAFKFGGEFNNLRII